MEQDFHERDRFKLRIVRHRTVQAGQASALLYVAIEGGRTNRPLQERHCLSTIAAVGKGQALSRVACGRCASASARGLRWGKAHADKKEKGEGDLTQKR